MALHARVAAVAFVAEGKVIVPVDFYDDSTAPVTIVDSKRYAVDWTIANPVPVAQALVIQDLNILRAATTAAASFNQNVTVGTVIG